MEQRLTDSIYDFKAKNIFKLLFYSFLVFIISFALNFPFERIIKSHVANALNSNSNCPIQYSNLNLTSFPPRVRIIKPSIQGRCFSGQKELKLNRIDIALSLPSFSPLGPSFNIKAQGKGLNVQVEAVTGLSETLIKIERGTLSSNVLNTITAKNNLFRGNFSIDSLVKLSSNKIKSGDLLLKSKNFGINESTIQAVTIPDLDIKNLLLKASIKGKILDIKDLVIGTDAKSAPINANFKGQIRMNTKAPGRSNYDLDGQLKLADSMFEDLGILSLVLPQDKRDQNGYYNLSLKGSFQGMPKATFKQ